LHIGIVCHASFGGSARVATELAKELSKREHIVHLFAYSPPFGQWDESNGVKLHTLESSVEGIRHPAQLYTQWKPTELNRFIALILDIIANEGLDILHFHYGIPFAFVAAEIKYKLGEKSPFLVGTLHGTDVFIHGHTPDPAIRLRKALKELHALTTVSRSHANLSQDVLRLADTPIVIPNSIDIDRFQPKVSIEDQKGFKGNKPRIIHISNFRPVKNSVKAAEIFVALRQQLEGELWLIGDGPEMDEVKSILARGEVDGDVLFMGLQQDVGPLLAESDLLLVTSEYESFCLVALEAMASGLPVIAPRVGGLPEVVKHGETGFLLPPGEYDVYVDCIVDLLRNREQYLQMRKNALNHAQQFASQRIVPFYENLYFGLISK